LVGHTGRLANSSVQTRNHAKTRTAIINGEQHTAKPATEQEPGTTIVNGSDFAAGASRPRTTYWSLAEKGKETEKETVFEMHEGRIRRIEKPLSGSLQTIETGSVFSLGPKIFGAQIVSPNCYDNIVEIRALGCP
jgi:hypothetical protein